MGLTTSQRKRKRKHITKYYGAPCADSFEQPKQWKMDITFRTMNVMGLYSSRPLKTVAGK
jgi:hypothetical protein